MKHLWSIICKESIIDIGTKNISIIDALEKISFFHSEELPEGKITLPCDFEIVSSWMRDDMNKEKSVNLLIKIIDPENKVVGEANHIMNFPDGDKKRMRTIIKSKGFPFTMGGQYWFKISINENNRSKLVAVIPIEAELKSISQK